MFGINGKTFVCFLIVLILTLSAGSGGLVIGFNSHNLFPSSWLSYLPTVGTENTLFLDLSEKPITNAYLIIEGNVKDISADEITIEDAGKSKSFKLGNDLKPLKMQAQKQEVLPTEKDGTVKPLTPLTPLEAIELKDIKKGDHVLATVAVVKNELLVTSLMVVVN